MEDSRMLNDEKWAARLALNKDLKKAVAAKCLEFGLISQFDHIFLDCGSTLVFIADLVFAAVSEMTPLNIYTTSVEVFQRYLECKDRNLLAFRLLGGRFIPDHNSFDGSLSTLFKVNGTPSVQFDRAFIGTCPIDDNFHIKGSITDFIEIKRKVISSSREVIVVCDESKFIDVIPGSRSVGWLESGMAGNLEFKLNESDQKIPARIIIGVKDPQKTPERLKRLIKLADERGWFANNSVILATPLTGDRL